MDESGHRGSLTQEYHLEEPNRYNGEVNVKQLKGSEIHWKALQLLGWNVLEIFFWKRPAIDQSGFEYM